MRAICVSCRFSIDACALQSTLSQWPESRGGGSAGVTLVASQVVSVLYLIFAPPDGHDTAGTINAIQQELSTLKCVGRVVNSLQVRVSPLSSVCPLSLIRVLLSYKLLQDGHLQWWFCQYLTPNAFELPMGLLSRLVLGNDVFAAEVNSRPIHPGAVHYTFQLFIFCGGPVC